MSVSVAMNVSVAVCLSLSVVVSLSLSLSLSVNVSVERDLTLPRVARAGRNSTRQRPTVGGGTLAAAVGGPLTGRTGPSGKERRKKRGGRTGRPTHRRESPSASQPASQWEREKVGWNRNGEGDSSRTKR